MAHPPILIHDISIRFGEKLCFANFSGAIYYGRRIAITGDNGQGKSLLLKIIQGLYQPIDGHVHVCDAVKFAYVPQIIDEAANLSGAERFIRALTCALALEPDVLCLDEPTNHLDTSNRRLLLRTIESLTSTLIVITHDRALLRCRFDSIWHIENKKIHTFNGSFDDFARARLTFYESLNVRKSYLQRERQKAHLNLMREQRRAKKRKTYGEKKYHGDKIALRSAQGRGQLTGNKNRKRLAEETKAIHDELSSLRLPEVVRPTFFIHGSIHHPKRPVLAIVDGSCGYEKPIVKGLNLQICRRQTLAIVGPNGSGKTTLAKAILGMSHISRSGEWLVPPRDQIGYLDQHYGNLQRDISPWQAIVKEAPSWSREQCRQHLNSFLLRKNEEINSQIDNLSGGEKARLSLALIATKTPAFLIIDEITNNLDMSTREHVIKILKAYPGALLVISHDEDFLRAIEATSYRLS